MSSYHFKNQSSMAPMHTHTERESALRMKKVRPTLPPPAVVFSSFLPGVSLTKGSPRPVGEKQTDVLFANPGEEEKFPSRDKETVVKKGVV